MKLCWETLNDIELYADNTIKEHTFKFMYYNKKINKLRCVEFVDYCKYCGCTYIRIKGTTTEFCDVECRRAYEIAHRKPGYQPISKERRLQFRKEASERMKLCNKRRRESGKVLDGKAVAFNDFADKISWCEEVREKNKILQVRCCVCKEWFTPKADQVYNRSRNVNEASGGYSLFVCSNKCINKCPKLNMSTRQIIKYDYQHFGKRRYSEINNIPKKVLYYDWQQKLKSFQRRIVYEKNRLIIEKEERRIKNEVKTQEKKKKEENKKKEKEFRKQLKKDPKYIKLKRLLYFSRVRAKQKNLENTLTYDWMMKNTGKKCPKCNISFNYDLSNHRNPFAPSIDRKDPTRGYTPDNCQIVSWMYNCGKCSFDEKTLYEVCKTIINPNLTNLN